MGNYLKHYNFFAEGFGALMALVYAGVGVLFIFSPDFLSTVTGNTRYILGIILVLYSGFRIYRIYRNRRTKNDEE